MSAPKKVLVWNEVKHRLDRERPHFESARRENYLLCVRQENYLLCVYPDFSFGNQSCHSLHDWFTLGALAADKHIC